MDDGIKKPSSIFYLLVILSSGVPYSAVISTEAKRNGEIYNRFLDCVALRSK